MSIQSPSVGVLDIKNATLRVGKLEVASVQGIDASLNTFKANSILLFDDQRPDTTRAFTTSGSAVYNSGNISLAGGAIYTGLGLPNAWVAEFEMAAPATGEGSSSVSFEFYSTDSIGGGGYKLNFNTDTDPQKIELSYNGTAITSANVDAGIEQVGYRKYVIIYERGAISVSIDGTRYFYHNDIERAGPYTVGTGGFVRFACAGTGLTRDLRKIKISNDGPWNFAASSSDIAYLNGNVGIGTNAPGYTLDVNGDINFSGNFYQGGSPFVSSEWTTGSESLYYRSNVEIGTANLFVDTTTSNVGIGTTIPGYTLDVNGDINFSGNFYQGGSPFVSSEWTTGSESLYYRSNVEIGTANLFVDTTTSNVGIGTTIPGYTLDVNGDINFSGNFYQGGSPFVSSEWTTGSESLYYRSNVEIGTANLFVDTTTGRVGVGTTSISEKLHVYGNILGHPVIKTRTITKGSSLSDETEAFTLNADENRIVLNNNQGSVGSTRVYRANFTSGVPTTVGTVLHLEINSQRVNTDATGRGHQSVIQFNGTSILDTGYIILSASGGADSYDRQLQRTIILTADGWKDYSMYPKISAPTTDDAIIFSTTEHASKTDLGNTELTERMRIDASGNVGIGTINPTAQLTLGASSGSQIAVTDNTRLFSNTHYLEYGTDASATFEQVLLQFDTGGTGSTDQSEYAGYVDVEMVVQRTQSTYHVDTFIARLNYMLGWHEQNDFWQVQTFIQENKGRRDEYRGLEGTPVFKYRYVDRQLQIYVSFQARQYRGYTSFTARVTSDNPADVSTPGPDALMASGTDGTAEVGICYGVGANAAYVGIGTTEPTESLDIVGNLNLQQVSNTASIKLNSNVVTEYTRSKKLIKYPRVAMTAATTAGYTASASTTYDSTSAAWQAFDGVNDANADGVHSWDSGINSYTGATPGVGQTSTFDGKTGEYINLKLPNKIRVISYQHWTRMDRDHEGPHQGFLYGSNDGFSTYTLLHNFDNITLPSVSMGVTYTHEVNSVNYYNEYRLLVTETQASTYLNIAELAFYGVPEYDPEAHGTDVIMRSVPNVPNTDWLAVYYDGQDYTSMPSTVTDKSGNSISGTPTGVTFDSTWKAFVFDEADDYITFNPNKSGNYVFSASVWFKSSGTSIETLFALNGDNTSNQGAWLYGAGNDLYFDFSNNAYTCGIGRSISDGRWHHVCCTYNGDGSLSGRDIYLDGMVLSGYLNGTSAGGTLNLTNSTSARIGAYNHPSLGFIHEFKGSIANFRLFNRALSADEVWQMYAYQKEYFDVSPDVVTFKGGRLGIGTSEPRAVLDVRGDAKFNFPYRELHMYYKPTAWIYNSSGTPLTLPYNSAGEYIYFTFPNYYSTNFDPIIKSDYRHYVPESGLYHVRFTTLAGGANYYEWFINKNRNARNNGSDINYNDGFGPYAYYSGAAGTLSAVIPMSTTDYITFGIYTSGTAFDLNNRCSACITLIQRF